MNPLLDCFQRGDVPRDVRLLAAQGALAPRADEQLALLAFLVGDEDADVARNARETLDSLPADAVAGVIARPETPTSLREFFASRGVLPAAVPSESDEPLIDASGADEPASEEDGKERVPISSLAVPARLKLAMKGTREQRAVLIRDPNRIIASAVLSSPKLSDTEVETFARMSNVSEDVLRVIGSNRGWMRKQAVAAALVKNPKTPPAISLSLLPRMSDREIKGLSVNRNVPEALRLAARKVIAAQQARKQ